MSKKPALRPSAAAAASVAAQQPSLFTQQQVQTQIYQGAIPPPEILAGFDQLVPGTSQRLIELAISESEHRRDLEQRAMSANIANQQQQMAVATYQTHAVFRSDALGQVAGVVVSLCCVGGAVYLAVSGQPWVAGVLAGLPLAAIIKAFRERSKQA
jgi:uncharacterized membrane protein